MVATIGEGAHNDGGGLYLRIKDGARYWLFRYADRRTGRERGLGIGKLDTWSLAEDRARARR